MNAGNKVALVLVFLVSITYGWDSGLLNVHVVPHSHNDPGWWKTFEGYYQDWTKGILSSVVEILAEDTSRKFIWAEISYFERWWQDQQEDVKLKVKKLVKNGQLEFVTAGWVMNDEANTHVVDIVNQLTEGHEWLFKTLNTKPTFGWAIDPFGHSPTMPYVLDQMGFEAIVINRAHKQIKEEFRNKQLLEFNWSGEGLNTSSSFKMLTHMLPWKLYDIPNTCGPSWETCEKFDFERPVAIPITSSNVKERSETLVNMYKEKAKLFRHNAVMIPLGDDFKYKNPDITRKMMTQYEMLFKYINSEPSLNVNIKFSTLRDYFEDVQLELAANGAASEKESLENKSPDFNLPSYQGDFFTYCDEGEDYWSGYFTTRPFMKGLTRSTQAILRTGEILATLARIHKVDGERRGQWFDGIQQARRNVALFQHHDGVTGTARRAVVEDYASRLLNSLAQVAEHSSEMALMILSKSNEESSNPLAWVTEPAKTIMLPTPRVIEVKTNGAVLVIFNSLAHARSEVVSVVVNKHELEVLDANGDTVVAQIDPVWVGNKPSKTQFMLHFIAQTTGFGLTTYFIRPSPRGAERSTVLEYSSETGNGEIVPNWHYDTKPLDDANSIVVENDRYKVHLNGQGNIKTITVNGDNRKIEVEQEFLKYSSHGGAYLFLPNGPATPMQLRTSAVRVLEGPVVVSVVAVAASSVKEHVLRLYKCAQQSSVPCLQAQGIELTHMIDLNDGNTEVVTRFKTNIANAGRFYTDSNGLEMREREYDKSLPIQGNYYPITASAFIESREVSSRSSRFTVLSHQAHGVASLEEGSLEIMLDRRLNSDDGRGLGESITDNVRTSIPLWLVLETGADSTSTSFSHPAISPAASDVWHTRNYPLHTLYAQIKDAEQTRESWEATHHLKIEPLSTTIHDRLQVLSLAPRDKESDDIVLRMFYPPVLEKVDSTRRKAPAFDIDMFQHARISNAIETSLSLLHEKTSNADKYNLKPAEISTWIIRLSPASTKATDLLPSETKAPPLLDQAKTPESPLTEESKLTETSKNQDRIGQDVNDKGKDKEGTVEHWKETGPEDDPFLERPNTKNEEPVDETDMIVPKKPKGDVQEDKVKQNVGDKQNIGDKHKSGGEGRVGKVSNDPPQVTEQDVKTSNTGLYTMSIIFYLGLLVVIVLGGWLLGRRHSPFGSGDDHKRFSRLPAVWKEREDSMMKLL